MDVYLRQGVTFAVKIDAFQSPHPIPLKPGKFGQKSPLVKVSSRKIGVAIPNIMAILTVCNPAT